MVPGETKGQADEVPSDNQRLDWSQQVKWIPTMETFANYRRQQPRNFTKNAGDHILVSLQDLAR